MNQGPGQRPPYDATTFWNNQHKLAPYNKQKIKTNKQINKQTKTKVPASSHYLMQQTTQINNILQTKDKNKQYI